MSRGPAGARGSGADRHLGAVVVSSARWEGDPLSKHHIARALAGLGAEVCYVDPPVSVLSPLRNPARLGDMWGARDAEVAPGLHLWRPWALPGQNSRLGQRMNAGLLARGLASRAGVPDLMVAFSLESRGLLGRDSLAARARRPRVAGATLYHCTDSIEDLPGVDAGAARRFEAELAQAADVVTACSLPLVAQLAARGIDARYVPHGCDVFPEVALTRRPSGGSDDGVPAVLAGRPRPWLGYVGSMNFRIDPSLLAAALEASCGGTLVLVGGAFGPRPAPSLADLAARPEVVVLGRRTGEELVELLRAFDVGLVPYGPRAFNAKSYPLKVPQYLAAGLAVASTPNGATEELSGFVEVGSGPEEFAAAVSRALDRASCEPASLRIDAVKERTWRIVAIELLEAAGVEFPASR